MKSRSLVLAIALFACSGNQPTETVEAARPPANMNPLHYIEVHDGLHKMNKWLAGVETAQTKAFLEADHAAKITEAKKRVRKAEVRAASVVTVPEGTFATPGFDAACGPQPDGDLPPCSTLGVESGGDLRVWNNQKGCQGPIYYPIGWTGGNRCGSTASGKWQFLRGTWNGYGGYVNAADAPAEIQNAKARELWANGAGCSHWNAC